MFDYKCCKVGCIKIASYMYGYTPISEDHGTFVFRFCSEEHMDELMNTILEGEK